MPVLTAWSYVQHPDMEDVAEVYDHNETQVGFMNVKHAKQICDTMNASLVKNVFPPFNISNRN